VNGYKQTPIGMLPEEWHIGVIEDLGEVVTGATPPTNDLANYGNEYMFVTPSDINGCKHINHTERHVSTIGLARCRKVPAGAVSFVCIGATIGKTAITTDVCATNQQINTIVPVDGNDPGYIYYVLKYMAKSIAHLASVQTIPIINKSQFSSIPVAIPEPKEQKAIGSTIDKWDRAIDLTEKLLTEKQQLRKGLMQQLFTGKRRLPGFGKQASAGKRPDDWTEFPLSELFNPVRRKNSKGVTRVLTASGEHGLVDQGTYFNRSVAGESLAGYFHLLRGEFAYNRSSMNGYPYGAIKRLDEHDEGVLSTLYICFAPTSKKCCSDFYKHLFEAGVINKLLRKIVQVGARAHGLLNVSLHDFFSVRVPCPPLNEQEQIASFLNRVDKEILLLHAKLNALKEQKKGLMQQLLTGKKRVTTCAT
jgi:type I restriction enzyme S subunit